MANPFLEAFAPSLTKSLAAGGAGGFAGATEGLRLAPEIEERQLLNALLKQQVATNPQMQALQMLMKQSELRSMGAPQPFHYPQGSIYGTRDPHTGKETVLGNVPVQPHPLAPETAEREKAQTEFYRARAASPQNQTADQRNAAALGMTIGEYFKYKQKGAIERALAVGQGMSGIRQEEKKNAPASFMERKYLAGVDALDTAQKDAMAMFNPSWVGPIGGRLTQIELKAGLGLDKDQAKFVAKYSTVKNRFVHELYGSALTAGEIQRAAQQFPELTDPPEVFREKMQATQDYITQMKQAGSKFAPQKQSPVSVPSVSTSPEMRFQQLVNEGLTEDEAYDTMHEEGY